MARMAQLLAGIPHTVPLSAVNRQCSSGLQAFANVAAAIHSGLYDVGIAGGVESMSTDDMGSVIPGVNFDVVKAHPGARDCLIPMGVTSENVASAYGISREVQDAFAAASHAKAAAAQKNGFFDAEIVPVEIEVDDEVIRSDPADKRTKKVLISSDDGVREGTTIERLSKLRPVFKKGGSTTAGNSSQMSDGAAAVLLMRRSRAQKLGMPILAILRSYTVVGVPPAVMGIGPAFAIPAALREAGISIDDVDVFEVNEAFASQATYCADQLEIPEDKLNPKGGAIALGHPLGCTVCSLLPMSYVHNIFYPKCVYFFCLLQGARQIGTLVHELHRTNKKYGLVSMCIGTGMGAAAIFERPQEAGLKARL
jgi:acetyl-CoA acyltransferase 1